MLLLRIGNRMVNLETLKYAEHFIVSEYGPTDQPAGTVAVHLHYSGGGLDEALTTTFYGPEAENLWAALNVMKRHDLTPRTPPPGTELTPEIQN